MKVKIKKLHPDAVIPKYAKIGDAGLDLTGISVEGIDGGVRIHTGLAIEIPENHVGLIFPRSSIYNKGLRLSNSVGVIDSGYRGEIYFNFDFNYDKITSFGMMDVSNLDISKRIYEVGERIGQLIIVPYPQIEFEEVEELSRSERGTDGFGSSGR